jgi:hypothetical protein
MATRKNHNGLIYLSGGMQFAADLGGAWREQVSAWLTSYEYVPLNITELDVAYTKEHGEMYRALTESDDLLERKANIRHHYIYADTELIRKHTDALIVYYDESVRLGAGTFSECQVAYDNELPIFIVNSYDDIHEIPGWLQALSTKMFSSFEELQQYFKTLPPGILRRDEYGNHSSNTYYLCSLSGEVFEKNKTHFVSKVSPLYSSECVDIVRRTHEQHKDRYQFFLEYLSDSI